MGVVGLAENKANSAQLELEAGAELGNIQNFWIGRYVGQTIRVNGPNLLLSIPGYWACSR